MSAQDNTEKILRSLHILLSKSEPYAKEPTKVIVDKQQVLDLLAQLNKSVYDIMDEYELTKQSRDRAQREFQKQGDEIVWNASRKAEDIYAASVIYTDENFFKIPYANDPESEYIAHEDFERLKERINSELSSAEREVLHLYLLGFDYTKIAGILKISKKSVDNALQRIRKKLR